MSTTIKKPVNYLNNKDILKQLEKSKLMMEFNREYLQSFLQEGTLSKSDLLAFYTGDAVKERYKPLEKEIEALWTHSIMT